MDKSEYSKKYREENKDKQKEQEREYREENKDKIRKYLKKYREENKDKLREQEREYHVKNKDKIREDRNKRYKKDPNFKLGSLIRVRIREELKNNNTKKTSKSAELIGCTVQEAREHLEKQFKKGMRWDNHGFKGWHIDHIKPISKFDLNNIDECKECWSIDNLQPLWWQENLKKSNKIL